MIDGAAAFVVAVAVGVCLSRPIPGPTACTVAEVEHPMLTHTLCADGGLSTLLVHDDCVIQVILCRVIDVCVSGCFFYWVYEVSAPCGGSGLPYVVGEKEGVTVRVFITRGKAK